MICQNHELALVTNGEINMTRAPRCEREATHQTNGHTVFVLCPSHARGYDKTNALMRLSGRTKRLT